MRWIKKGRRAASATALLWLLTQPVFAAEVKIGIDNFSFTPASVTIKPGDTIVFENHDDIPHLVVDSAGKFRSKALDTNDRFSVSFDKPGAIAYFCGLHPQMKGRIVVAP
jgi:plastocyanin